MLKSDAKKPAKICDLGIHISISGPPNEQKKREINEKKKNSVKLKLKLHFRLSMCTPQSE